MLIIGLTGGIACGKSAVSDTLKRHFNAVILDIDKITQWLLQPNGELFKIYVKHFGERVVSGSGNLNKKLIGEIIFNDDSERQWINSVSHPILLNRARDFLVECNDVGTNIVVMEVPLLFEVGWENLFDRIWAVYVPQKIQIKRLMCRDKLTYAQALKRISAQMSTKEICNRADVVIENNGRRTAIIEQVSRAILR
ncbi:MAG: dephospho-CoA kinase [Selenomonadaceae bacterium]|nr:dephospho-CoA kinase [Selenomonadaceae bacterium]